MAGMYCLPPPTRTLPLPNCQTRTWVSSESALPADQATLSAVIENEEYATYDDELEDLEASMTNASQQVALCYTNSLRVYQTIASPNANGTVQEAGAVDGSGRQIGANASPNHSPVTTKRGGLIIAQKTLGRA